MTSAFSTSLNELSATHHIRIKCAAEMFHTLVRQHPPEAAASITCDILKISQKALEYALETDFLAELKRSHRDLMILKKRAAGYAPKQIAKETGLSRVQVWRVIRELQADLETVEALQKRKIRGKARLKYHEMPS